MNKEKNDIDILNDDNANDKVYRNPRRDLSDNKGMTCEVVTHDSLRYCTSGLSGAWSVSRIHSVLLLVDLD